MPITLKQAGELIEQVAPLKYAYDWDNSGFNIGLCNDVEGIFVCLDVTEEYVLEAKKKGCSLIVAHHPLLFHPLKSIDRATHIGKTVCALIENGISLYACHTPMDNVPGGINTYTAEKLGLKNIRLLHCEHEKRFCKIVVTVPEGYEGAVKAAMHASGAGEFGNYTDSAFTGEGVGQFKPNNDANPFLGKAGITEYAHEKRIEAICEERAARDVVAAARAAHPYEEPSIDVYPLEYPREAAAGAGVIGELDEAKEILSVADDIKKALSLDVLRIGGKTEGKAKKIAICGGGAGDLIPLAAAEVDIYLTGEIKHSAYMDAEDFTIMEGGHFDTEKCFVKVMAQSLQRAQNELQYNVRVCVPDNMTRPYINY